MESANFKQKLGKNIACHWWDSLMPLMGLSNFPRNDEKRYATDWIRTCYLWVRKGMKVGKSKQWAIDGLTVRGTEKVTVISVNTSTSLTMWALLSTVYFKLLSSKLCTFKHINRWTKKLKNEILKSLQKYRKTFCYWLDSNLLPVGQKRNESWQA